jgi:acetyl esterase/lipase
MIRITGIVLAANFLAGITTERSSQAGDKRGNGQNPQAEIQATYSTQTITYKTVGECKAELTVYRNPGDEVRPALMFIHGGALIGGSRTWIPLDQLRGFLDAGFVVVSIDYRLAPETKLPDIIEDLKDAYRWLQVKGPPICKTDPARTVVVGGSAGGYLTLMAGFCCQPRPKALVSFYGFGDITGDWCNSPNPSFGGPHKVSREEAYRAVGNRVISGSTDSNRFKFFVYCKQQGLWARAVSGHDPATEPRFFERFCPIRNVTGEYPPTILLHGDRDDDVAYQQSVDMAKELTRCRVEQELITVKNGGHGFDSQKGGLKDPDNAERFRRVVEFVKRHVK